MDHLSLSLYLCVKAKANRAHIPVTLQAMLVYRPVLIEMGHSIELKTKNNGFTVPSHPSLKLLNNFQISWSPQGVSPGPKKGAPGPNIRISCENDQFNSPKRRNGPN